MWLWKHRPASMLSLSGFAVRTASKSFLMTFSVFADGTSFCWVLCLEGGAQRGPSVRRFIPIKTLKLCSHWGLRAEWRGMCTPAFVDVHRATVRRSTQTL